MGLYFCPNCHNLKTRTLKRKDIRRFSKYKILKAIKENNIDSLGLSFPINKAVYRRLTRNGSCEIIYCSEGTLGRNLYIYHEGIEGGLTPNKNRPCPKYK